METSNQAYGAAEKGNKSVLSLVRRLSTRHCSLLSSGARAAANQLRVVAAIDRRDRQTDGRTPYRYIDAHR